MASEEDIVKRRLLLNMQRRILAKQVKSEIRKQPDYYTVFMENLSEDGKQMYSKALEQYPSIAPKIAEAIGKLYTEGKMQGVLDAEVIYGIFQEMGFPIRIETRVVYKKRGEVKSISELLKESKED